MKNKASVFLKQIISALGSLIKAKSIAVKSKTNAMKARIIIFGLLKNKKVLLPALSHKIHALLGHVKRGGEGGDDDDENKKIVVCDSMADEAPSNACRTLAVIDDGDNYNDGEEDDDKYPDLTHSLFDELEFDDGSGSVVDLVRKSREDGSDFNLEDEIDHVADVFIRRFHRQMKMQKQESFKRYKEMLDRSA
ncbi:hypothetical protein MRB53_027325 [Persea americana]|uniref:Uncharacterized protein n=1 Tax=Persea americana TaxID=3435 RepID=A0ACC2LLQ6_PERAE|nr:hypothetical protein MRB53_027325 [Persea americana]|eukprot:TRINITY_DN15871_c0_g1_i1.p1 TRINITY_DN15871_c0_g1~~TRINITY_DN15871_c0_g1_i1.p1  ORF type:complete len:193 (+),score=41.15 TRINITY_DN15871_c0_g1_i1:97-675(+)